MKSEQAELLALQALGWLAQDSERLGHFLNASGARPDDLRERAQDVEFLGFILDFMLMDDRAIIEFSDENDLNPESIQQALTALSGDQFNWT